MDKIIKSKTRLVAVQIIFQSLVNKKKIINIKEDFDNYYRNQVIDLNGEKIEYNVNFLSQLINLFINTSLKIDFDKKINEYINFDRLFHKWDLINQSIMMMAISEIINAEKNRQKIIINEYIEISKLFVNLNDIKIINAILDKFIDD